MVAVVDNREYAFVKRFPHPVRNPVTRDTIHPIHTSQITHPAPSGEAMQDRKKYDVGVRETGLPS